MSKEELMPSLKELNVHKGTTTQELEMVTEYVISVVPNNQENQDGGY